MTNSEKYLKDEVSIEEVAKEFESFCEALKESYIVMTYKQEMKEFLNCEAKPTLTEDERIILRNIKGYTTIIRTMGEDNIQVENEDGSFACLCAFNHLFQFIRKRRKIRNRGVIKMKVKDYDFKYNMIEMIHSNLEGTKLGKIALLPIKTFMRDYGNMEVLSVQDFNDTKSTSVIIYNKDLD